MTRHASTSLASFIRAAETGSFAAAAKILGISAAAVGQNVKRMEDAYGVRLLVRTTRRMSLTPEGQLLFQRSRGPLQELDQIDSLFDESRGVVAGVLRLSAPGYLARKMLIPLMREFRKQHPGIEFELDASDTARDFIHDPVDLAFRWCDPGDSSMITRRISELPTVTLAAPCYIAEHGMPNHPHDLDHHDCIQFRLPGSRDVYLWAFEIGGELTRLQTSGAVSVNDAETLLSAAVAGLGIIQADTFTAMETIKSGQLIPVLTTYATAQKGLHLSYPARTHLPLRVRAFIDFVLGAIPDEAYCVQEVCKFIEEANPEQTAVSALPVQMLDRTA